MAELTVDEYALRSEEFESSLDSDYKKDNGIYYTDVRLAGDIIRELGIDHHCTVLDPCCGTGSFLYAAAAAGCKQLYGADIVDNAVRKCKDLTGLTSIKRLDTLGNSGEFTLNALGSANRMDYIIGNPPYAPIEKKVSIHTNDSDFLRSVKNAGNNLFIAAIYRAFELAKDGGYISYIIPKNFLHISSYRMLRRKILRTKQIISIIDIGAYFSGVRGEQIILTLQNVLPEYNDIQLKRLGPDGQFIDCCLVPQSFYTDKILLFKNNEDYSLYCKMQKPPYRKFSDHFSNCIRRGKADCPNAVGGKDIRKFGFKNRPIPLKGTQLFIQNIYSSEAGIIASFAGDYEAGQTVTIVTCDDERICRYLVGILHSNLCNYYLVKFCYNASKLTMHTDSKYLSDLPLVMDDKTQEFTQLVDMVRALEAMDYMSPEWFDLFDELNILVYQIYHIDDTEAAYIDLELSSIQSKRWHMINEKKKCNDLTGKEWLQNSFSIWRELTKTQEEKAFKHPASYPVSLCEKLIRTFARADCNVLDPFNGIGSTMAACHNLGCRGTGIDLSEEFGSLARGRIEDDPNIRLIVGDSFEELDKLEADSFDLCVTSPPYWDILNMKRSADLRESVNYSDKENDMGNIPDYDDFIHRLGDLFEKVRRCLRVGGYCLVNVMDIRKKSRFYPLHSDLATELQKRGYLFDDLIIWDRQSDYNNMKPLGYPYKFRINKVHEYILIFIKEK